MAQTARTPVRIRYARRSRWSGLRSAWICWRARISVSRTLDGALDPSFAGAAGLAGIERLARHGVGEFRQGPAIVDLGLGPLDLELVQDPGQLGDLLLVQVELVGEEPQRPAHAEPRARLEPISLVVMVAVASHEPSSWLTMIVMSVVLMMLSAIVFVMGMDGGWRWRRSRHEA